MKALLMGNEAIALAALHAGVSFISGYPGTPSSEIVEACARRRASNVYVEWSVNEKAAVEVAAGAAYSGRRAMVTMKQVGLNAACDPVMNVNYVGVGGALVLVVCDDPGPISSQTEQDTRKFSAYARIPVFDPESPEEAYRMTIDAFEASEKYGTPVILRPTTRVCHSCAVVELREEVKLAEPGVFVKDSKWVIFPKLSFERKKRLFEREPLMADDFSDYRLNEISGDGEMGIAAGGVSAAYARDALDGLPEARVRLLKIATPYPFPEALAVRFLKGLKKVLVFEELDPVIEDQLIYIAGKYHLDVEILGKHTSGVRYAGENSALEIRRAICGFLSIERDESAPANIVSAPPLPARPPVLCAGCPHRASFYAVKRAMDGKRAVFSGDIGCYTLGNAAPLHMVDTCLCMGAGITIAQGLSRTENNGVQFAFIGDSTFFHSGITGVINAVYNGADEVIVVLDNRTTAMTGNQPHPGTGKTVMGTEAPPLSIPRILEAVGVSSLEVLNPFDHDAARAAVGRAAGLRGVRAIVFEGACAAQNRRAPFMVSGGCVGCKKCVRELGCPAISFDGGAHINQALCAGCGLCAQNCPAKAIVRRDTV